MIRGLVAAMAMVLALGTLPAAAQEKGPTILTIAGDIANANRGAVDKFDDIVMTFNDLEFDKAFEFDRSSLAALTQHKLVTKYPGQDVTVEVEGPLLSDVLAQAGANGETVKLMALDGYAVELPLAELEKFPVVLALKNDGEWLGLGGRGPTWVVYPQDDFSELAERDDANWIFSVFYIGIE